MTKKKSSETGLHLFLPLLKPVHPGVFSHFFLQVKISGWPLSRAPMDCPLHFLSTMANVHLYLRLAATTQTPPTQSCPSPLQSSLAVHLAGSCSSCDTCSF